MRAALVQMTSTGAAPANLRRAEEFIRTAAADGAKFVLTPEVTNLIAPDGDALRRDARPEHADPCLARLRSLAAELNIWLLIGSLTLLEDGADLAVNRSILINPAGGTVARYDKIHMFRADLPGGETYDEARRYQPGDWAVLAQTPLGAVGLTICYDLRFPGLYRALAQAGAQILTVPAAFTVPTGQAHWETLLRARAIETGCFVLAPAQWGVHGPGSGGGLRRSYGHSLIVDPWGAVLADGGEGEGVISADLDLSAVDLARSRTPSLTGDRPFTVETHPANLDPGAKLL